MRRLAGDFINEYLREGRLAANRSQPIGAGSYGTVYNSDVPGNVIKDIKQDYIGQDGSMVEKETNLQALAADMGLAPRVESMETFRGGVGNRIEMQDMRPTHYSKGNNARQFPVGMDAVRVEQQIGQLALKGVDLQDRHTGNIMYNNMTNRPTQLDFGRAERVQGEDQVAALANATEKGLTEAGLFEEAQIYSETVYDLLAGGQVNDAMDVAKQGFNQLQKIKGPAQNYGSAKTVLAQKALADLS